MIVINTIWFADNKLWTIAIEDDLKHLVVYHSLVLEIRNQLFISVDAVPLWSQSASSIYRIQYPVRSSNYFHKLECVGTAVVVVFNANPIRLIDANKSLTALLFAHRICGCNVCCALTYQETGLSALSCRAGVCG